MIHYVLVPLVLGIIMYAFVYFVFHCAAGLEHKIGTLTDEDKERTARHIDRGAWICAAITAILAIVLMP